MLRAAYVGCDESWHMNQFWTRLTAAQLQQPALPTVAVDADADVDIDVDVGVWSAGIGSVFGFCALAASLPQLPTANWQFEIRNWELPISWPWFVASAAAAWVARYLVAATLSWIKKVTCAKLAQRHPLWPSVWPDQAHTHTHGSAIVYRLLPLLIFLSNVLRPTHTNGSSTELSFID